MQVDQEKMASKEACLQETIAVLRFDPECDIANATTTDDDVTQYLEDPALHHDLLPQPYRRVNKLLTEIVDAACDIIDEREAKILHEASRVRPPQYDTASNVEDFGSVACLGSCCDGKYVVVGLSDGRLVCIDAAHQRTAAEWKSDNSTAAAPINFTDIRVTIITDRIYLIAAVDSSSGCIHLFVHFMDFIFLAATLYDSNDVNKKGASVQRSIISHCADYIGLHLALPGTTLAPAASNLSAAAGNADGNAASTLPTIDWLEVYHIPRETWIKELEPVVQLVHRTSSEFVLDQLSTSTLQTGSVHLPSQALSQQSQPQFVSETPAQSLHQDDSTARNIPEIKFTPPSLVLKVRPPSHPKPITWSSAQQALKVVESSLVDQLIGTGVNNLVSKQHLELRMAAFEHQHMHLLKLFQASQQQSTDLPPSSDSVVMQPNFHFLTSQKPMTDEPTVNSSTITSAATATAQQAEPSSSVALPVESTASVVVWWNGFPHVMHYNLVRPAKDVEALHADTVWPMSHPIVASAASDTNPLLAFALTNDDIIIFDINIGSCVRVVKIEDGGPMRHMFFHKTLHTPVKNNSYSDELLVESYTGQIYIIPCIQRDTAPPKAAYVEIEGEEEIPLTIKPIHGMPQLIVVCRQDGRLYIHDIVKSELQCELVLPVRNPENVLFCPPLQPLSFTAADCGRMLYVIAEQEERQSEFDIPENQLKIIEQSGSQISEPAASEQPTNIGLDGQTTSGLDALASTAGSRQVSTSLLDGGQAIGTSKRTSGLELSIAPSKPASQTASTTLRLSTATTLKDSQTSELNLPTATPKRSQASAATTNLSATSARNSAITTGYRQPTTTSKPSQASTLGITTLPTVTASKTSQHSSQDGDLRVQSDISEQTRVPSFHAPVIPQLLVYKLMYLPTLDGYEFTQQEETKDTAVAAAKMSLQTRISQALLARFKNQSELRERLQQRWTQLKAQMSQSPFGSGSTTTSSATVVQTKG